LGGTSGHADLIRSSYGALNRGDVQAALAALHRDAVWTESAELPGADSFEGREAIENFLGGFLEQWDVFHQEVTSVIAEGDRALAMITLTAIGRESGAQVRANYAHLWTMREGLGAAVDAFYDPEKALAELRAE
jgi:ketosteroid isomerase-like protein